MIFFTKRRRIFKHMRVLEEAVYHLSMRSRELEDELQRERAKK